MSSACRNVIRRGALQTGLYFGSCGVVGGRNKGVGILFEGNRFKILEVIDVERGRCLMVRVEVRLFV